MSNPSKDHTSIRVHAPPGGHTSNIFGTSEFEQSAANKKKHMQSDIFGTKQDNVDPAPVKQTHNTGSNIFGSDPQETAPKAGTIAGQYKQTQMKSNIFGTDEPTAARTVSDKNKSNIFGVGDNDDPHKRQAGGIRQGLRDPNASRMGYNPINGESYAVNTKTNENEKQQPESAAKAPEVSNDNAQTANPTENENAPPVAAENGNTPAVPAETKETASAQAAPPADNKNDQKVDNAQKNVHTSVRVFHPPGGKSNGPLW